MAPTYSFSFRPEFLIYLISCAGFFFLAFALWILGAREVHGRKYLAILLMCFGAIQWNEFYISSGLFRSFTFPLLFTAPLDYLLGPMVLFYLHSLRGQRISGSQALVHLLPFLLLVLVMLPFWCFPGALKLQVMDHVYTGFPLEEGLALYVRIASAIMLPGALVILCYLLRCLQLLGRHDREIRESFSDLSEVGLHWLRNLIRGLIALALIYVFYSASDSFFSFGEAVEKLQSILMHTSIAIVLGILGVLGMRQPQIFNPSSSRIPASPEKAFEPVQARSAPAPALLEKKNKYQSSPLNEMSLQQIEEALVLEMNEQRPWLENGLTLKALADRLQVLPNYLSQVINERFEQNFFDFVNSYRIREAWRLLEDPGSTHLSISGIALECGFSSRSTFYTAFRKLEERTPSQYREQFLRSSM